MSNYQTPKPTYTPSGTRRCKRCGKLVRIGRPCKCAKAHREFNGATPVRISYTEPSAPKVEKRIYTKGERKAFDDALVNMSKKSKKKSIEDMPTVYATCQDCGTAFPRKSVRGIVPKRCPECTAEYKRRQHREAYIPRNNIEENTCVICGAKMYRRLYGGTKPKYCEKCKPIANKSRCREWRENRAGSES